MKTKTILSVLPFLFIYFSSFGQSCLPGGIIISSQEHVDNFASNYPGCQIIEGTVHINESLDIYNLEGLSQITQIEGSLVLLWNDHLQNLAGLENLTKIEGDLTIDRNESLESIAELGNLTQVGRSIFIKFNTVLESLHGLENLTHVEKFFYLFNNPVLQDLSGIGNITYVGSELKIQGNDQLKSLEGLNYLNTVGWGLFITGNPELTNISALSFLNYIGYELLIGGNPSLQSLDGLNNLHTIGARLEIANNDLLSNLSGLEGLTTIGSYIRISRNDGLLNLDGIQNIDPASINSTMPSFMDIQILENSNLSDCAVQSICGTLTLPETTTSIEDNKSGCNTREEIKAACLVPVTDGTLKPELQIFPNPVKSVINIESETGSTKSFIIYNLYQQAVITGVIRNNEIRLPELNPGLYVIEIDGISKRFIKI